MSPRRRIASGRPRAKTKRRYVWLRSGSAKTVVAINSLGAFTLATVAELDNVFQPLIQRIHLTEFIRAGNSGQDVFATRGVYLRRDAAADVDPQIETDLSFMWWHDDLMRWETGQESDPRGFIRVDTDIKVTRRTPAVEHILRYTIKNGPTSGTTLEFTVAASVLIGVP